MAVPCEARPLRGRHRNQGNALQTSIPAGAEETPRGARSLRVGRRWAEKEKHCEVLTVLPKTARQTAPPDRLPGLPAPQGWALGGRLQVLGEGVPAWRTGLTRCHGCCWPLGEVGLEDSSAP